eukprot:IDg7081t1
MYTSQENQSPRAVVLQSSGKVPLDSRRAYNPSHNISCHQPPLELPYVDDAPHLISTVAAIPAPITMAPPERLLFVSAAPLNATASRRNALCQRSQHQRMRRVAHDVYMSSGNSYGRLFRVSTWGESHGGGVGVTVDGCPPRLHLSREDIQRDLDRRRPGQNRIVTPRNEPDAVEILSGVVDGITVGTPIAMLVRNKDARSQDYDTMAVAYRPSHADAAYDAKYGLRAVAGGGRSSARETIGRVAAGAVARELLKAHAGVEVVAYVQRVRDVEMPADAVNADTVTVSQVDATIARCPHEDTAERMISEIDAARKTGNSVGGVVEVIARGVPAGLGSPVFDKLEAELAKACMSLPA